MAVPVVLVEHRQRTRGSCLRWPSRARVASMLSRISPSTQSSQVATEWGEPSARSVATTAGFGSRRTPRSRVGRESAASREPTRVAPGVPVALQSRVRLPERHRAVVRVSLALREVGLAGRDELLFARTLLDPARPGVEPGAQLGEMPADVVGDAEVGQGELLGRLPFDLLERAVPALDVDVRRRRRGSTDRLGWIRTPAASPA